MLEKVDLSQKVSKKEYKKRITGLQDRLYRLQKATWDANLPVVILFEGWDAAGKGTSIQTLTSRLDPRGFKLYPIREARTYEKKRPWLWRYWLKTPARGEIAIFDRSWYGRVLVERVEGFVPDIEWRRGYRDIVDFERTLADDGALIIKFFLHISSKEQKKRFKRLLQDPLSAWKVEPEDWEHHAKYDEYVLAIEEMLERTDTEWGPWTIVEATDRRHTRVKIFETIVMRLENRLTRLDKLPEDYRLVMETQTEAQPLAEEVDMAETEQALPDEAPQETPIPDAAAAQEPAAPAAKKTRKSQSHKSADTKKQPAAQGASLENQEE